MKSKELQQIIYTYVKQSPNQQVKALSKRSPDLTDGAWLVYLKAEGHITPFTSPEDFTSFFNGANACAKTLVDMGVLEHIKGIRGYRIPQSLTDPAAKLLMMGASERWGYIKAGWATTPQGRNLLEELESFYKMHEKSPFFDPDAQYPEGTADGLSSLGKRWIAQKSHVIDRWITRALGLPPLDKSANMLLEHIAVNMGRYHGDVTTDVIPGALVYRLSTCLGKGLELRDGQALRVPNLTELRSAFLLRKRLLVMLESDSLLQEIAAISRALQQPASTEEEC